MAYLYSIALRVTNNVAAPLRVAYCKSREVLIPSTNIETTKIPIDENKDNVINVDGIDSQATTKKMGRLNPPTSFVTSYIHFFSGPTEVYGDLYLGSAYNAACWYTLESLGIKYIINVTAEIDNYYEHCGITYFKIPIKDDNNESIKIYLEDSYDKIDEFLSKKDGKVLVHCYMGASRSASIVAYFTAKKTGADITEVIGNLIERRPVVNPTQQLVADLITHGGNKS